MANFIISCFADEIGEDLKVQLRVMKEQGINHMEMRNVNGKSILKYSLKEAAEIKKELDNAGVKLSAIGSYIGKQSITEEFTHSEELKHCIDLAKLFGTDYIRIFSFFIPEGEAGKYRNEVMDRMSVLTEIAESAGINLLHENEKDIYGDVAERCLDIYHTINSPYLKLIFDPANFIQCNVTTYPDAWNLLKDNVVYLHIKDALSNNGTIMPAGSGDGKIYEILKDLNKRDTDIFLSIEPHLANFSGFASLESSLKTLPAANNIEQFILAHTALKQILSGI